MGWATTLTNRLRYYIGDVDAPQTYTDTTLQVMLAIAAIDVLTKYQEWDIGGPYTVDTDATPTTITPDPTRSDVPQAIGNLIVLRAAIVLNRTEMRSMFSSAGYKITDDKSTIDTTAVVDVLKSKSQLWGDEYLEACQSFESGNAFAGGAVLAPYNSINFPSLDINRGPRGV